MKKSVLLLVLCLILLLTACSSSATHPNTVMAMTGVDITGCTVISDRNSHGGFFGEGETTVVFDCSKIAESMEEQTKSWSPLPLSENLQRIMYGDTTDDGSKAQGLAQKNDIPQIENGGYYFVNNQLSGAEAREDAFVLSGTSVNFTLILYDEDTCRLYYYDIDT